MILTVIEFYVEESKTKAMKDIILIGLFGRLVKIWEISLAVENDIPPRNEWGL